MPAAGRPLRQSSGSLARWPFPSSPPSPEAWSRCSPASCAAWARSTSSRPAPACRSKAPSRRPTASACGRASPAACYCRWPRGRRPMATSSTRRRTAWTGRVVPRHPRDGLPRLPVVAPRRPRATAAGHGAGGRWRRALRDDVPRGLGVSFQGTLETAYRVCLWSRLAGRVLLPLATGPAADGDELYATTYRVDWDAHLGVDGTLAVDFSGTSDTIRDTRYGAVRMKDAVVDQFRARHGDRRPSVDTRAPDLRINGHLVRGRVTVSLDLSGDSLHRRGYRTDRVQVEAPLKENLAAAVLLFAAWPQEAAGGGSFLDPLCGSGTLTIEAAFMAADIAPGLLRAEGLNGFAFLRWRGHDAVSYTH